MEKCLFESFVQFLIGMFVFVVRVLYLGNCILLFYYSFFQGVSFALSIEISSSAIFPKVSLTF